MEKKLAALLRGKEEVSSSSETYSRDVVVENKPEQETATRLDDFSSIKNIAILEQKIELVDINRKIDKIEIGDRLKNIENSITQKGDSGRLPNLGNKDAKNDIKLSESLNKILNFLKKNREEDKLYREKQLNFESERKEEQERKDEEFLKTLSELKAKKPMNIADYMKSGGKGFGESAESGLFGFLQKFLSGIMKTFSVLKDLLAGIGKLTTTLGKFLLKLPGLVTAAVTKVFGGVKNLLTLLPKLGAFLATPLGAALIGGTALAFFVNELRKQMDAIRENPYDPKFKDNAYAMFVRGEAKSTKQAGQMLAQRSVRVVPRPQIQELVKSDIPDDDLVYQYGLDKKGLEKWLTENPNEKFYKAPVKGKASYADSSVQGVGQNESAAETARLQRQSAPAVAAESTPSTQLTPQQIESNVNITTPPAQLTPQQIESNVNITTPPAQLTPQQIESRVTPVTAEPSTTAIPTVSDDLGTQMRSLVEDNADLKLFEDLGNSIGNAITNVSMISKGTVENKVRSLPAVRNLEDTFQRMIYNSTRVV